MKFSYMLGALTLVSPLSATLAATSEPEDRYRLVALADDYAVFVDERSLTRSGEIRRYWEVVAKITDDLNQPELIKASASFDCGARTKTIHHIYASRDGAHHSEEHGDATPKLVIPDTTGELLFDFVCSNALSSTLSDISLFSMGEVLELRQIMQDDANEARD